MDPFAQLLTQSSGSNVAPETLEMLGRQASQLFQGKGIPLNQAITQVTANHPELGNEHIKRIVEFANQVTFQEMFANSEDKNIHFEVADPGVVLRDLKDGGSPAHSGKPLNSGHDFMASPQTSDPALNQAFDAQFLGQEKNAADLQAIKHTAKKNGKMMLGAAALAGSAYAGYRGAKRLIDGKKGKEKTAAEIREELAVDHDLHANPIEDVYDTHVRLQATRNKLAESHETMHGILKQAQEDFYQEVKSQVLDPDGAGLGGVIAVLEKVAEEDIVEALMVPVTQRLVQDGVRADELNSSLTKTAGVVVNMEHPLIAHADAIVKVAGEIIRCSAAIDETDKMLEQTGSTIKQAGALTNGIRDAVGHKGQLPAGIRQRFPRT